MAGIGELNQEDKEYWGNVNAQISKSVYCDRFAYSIDKNSEEVSLCAIEDIPDFSRRSNAVPLDAVILRMKRDKAIELAQGLMVIVKQIKEDVTEGD